MKKLLIIFSLVFFVGMSGSDPAQAISLDFSDLQEVGNQVSAGVVIKDLAGEIVSAYNLAVGYNSSVLSAEDVIFSGALGDPFFSEVLQGKDLTGVGVVRFSELSFLFDDELSALQGGTDVLLATLLFSKNTVAASMLTATGTGSHDFGLEFIWGPENEVIGSGDKRLLPAPVPEPATIFLLGAGLVGFAGFGRRSIKKRKILKKRKK
jgi:hypothetical protein